MTPPPYACGGAGFKFGVRFACCSDELSGGDCIPPTVTGGDCNCCCGGGGGCGLAPAGGRERFGYPPDAAGAGCHAPICCGTPPFPPPPRPP